MMKVKTPMSKLMFNFNIELVKEKP